MTPSNMISVIVAICFVVSIGLGDTPLLYYAARLSPQDGDVIFFDLGAGETRTLEKLVADPPEALEDVTFIGIALRLGQSTEDAVFFYVSPRARSLDSRTSHERRS